MPYPLRDEQHSLNALSARFSVALRATNILASSAIAANSSR